MNKNYINKDVNMAKIKVERKINILFIWIIVVFVVWFIKSDNNLTDVLKELFCRLLYAEKGYNSNIIDDDIDDYAIEADLYEHADILSEQVYIYCTNNPEDDSQYASGNEVLKDNNVDADDSNNTKEQNSRPLIDSDDEEYITAMAGCLSFENSILTDFDLIKTSYYVVDASTYVYPEELDGKQLSEMDLTIDTSDDDYKILIYHTHSTECYADSEAGERSDTVVGVGDYLAELLSDKYGVKVLHDDTSYDIVDGELDRSAAYDYARQSVIELLNKYPSIEVVIDLHRDGVPENAHLVTEVNGKQTAQLMFLNGMSRLSKNGDIEYLPNENKTYNMAFALQLYLTARANYDNLMRRIYLRGYRYNLDLAKRSLLVEVGGQTNTVLEAKNAMEPLAAIIYKVLSGK